MWLATNFTRDIAYLSTPEILLTHLITLSPPVKSFYRSGGWARFQLTS